MCKKNIASDYYIQKIFTLEYQKSYIGFSLRQHLAPSLSLHVLMTFFINVGFNLLRGSLNISEWEKPI